VGLHHRLQPIDADLLLDEADGPLDLRLVPICS
jgi:hypothetical protein